MLVIVLDGGFHQNHEIGLFGKKIKKSQVN